MSLVTFTIPNLTNGVSQQPVTIRLPNQGEEQINSNCRVTDGLSKRSPTKFIDFQELIDPTSGLPIALSDNGFAFHKVSGKDNFDTDTLAEIIVRGFDGAVYVRYLEGLQAGTTQHVGDYAYLVFSDKKDLKFLTTANTTYILNRSKEVRKTTFDEAPEKEERIQGTLAYVQQGFFGTNYKITMKLTNVTLGTSQTVTATYNTPNSTGSDLTALQTDQIRTNIQSALATAISGAGGDISTKTELVGANNWIHIKLKEGIGAEDDYVIECDAFSSTARTAFFTFNGVIKDVANIPQIAPEGYTLRVAIGGEDLSDDYYLKYSSEEAAWIESARLGLVNNLDPSTMPMRFKDVLTSHTDFTAIELKDRKVGDQESNPDPSFVGEKISDLFIFYNRLGFLSTNNVIMSQIDSYDNFYKTTTASNKASDRIDLAASVPSTRYSDLNFAVPFDKELILFGTSAQYSLSANTGFDVKTANLSTLTEYEADPNVPPLNIGASIYFPIIRGEYTAIFDLARRGNIGLTAEEITQHVPVYIEGDIEEMVHSATENMVFLRTKSKPRTIYVQNRFVRDSQLQQNAWHKWEVPNDVVSIQIIGSKLYINMISEDKNYLIRTYVDISLTLIKQSDSTSIDFLPYIDKQLKLAQGSTVSTVDDTADYFVHAEDTARIVGVGENGFTYSGVADINAALVNEPLWVGTTYKFSYTFSEQVPAMYNEQGKTALQYARMSIQSMKIAYVNSGKFTVRIKAKGRDEHQARFSGVILGSPLAIIGRVNINTGVFKFPVHSRADAVRVTIESDQPYPVTFNTCELQGKLITNSGRM